MKFKINKFSGQTLKLDSTIERSGIKSGDSIKIVFQEPAKNSLCKVPGGCKYHVLLRRNNVCQHQNSDNQQCKEQNYNQDNYGRRQEPAEYPNGRFQQRSNSLSERQNRRNVDFQEGSDLVAERTNERLEKRSHFQEQSAQHQGERFKSRSRSPRKDARRRSPRRNAEYQDRRGQHNHRDKDYSQRNCPQRDNNHGRNNQE